MSDIKIYTIRIGDYLPELCKITLPSIKAYADKIGASYEVITERKFHKWPITYEKMQLFERAKDSEWTILVDADTVIGNLADLTERVPNNHIGIHMAYDADKFLPSRPEFDKDGRNVGVVTNFMVVPRSCRSIWKPLDDDPETILADLARVNSTHIVDEFCVSLNLCKHHIPFVGLTQFGDYQFLHLSATIENDRIMERARSFLAR